MNERLTPDTGCRIAGHSRAFDLPTNHAGAPHAGVLLTLLDATCLAAVLAAALSATHETWT